MKKVECESIDRKLEDLIKLFRNNIVGIDGVKYRKLENLLNDMYIEMEGIIKEM